MKLIKIFSNIFKFNLINKYNKIKNEFKKESRNT